MHLRQNPADIPFAESGTDAAIRLTGGQRGHRGMGRRGGA